MRYLLLLLLSMVVVELFASWPDRDIRQLQTRDGNVKCYVHRGTSSDPLNRTSFDCLAHTALSTTIVFLDDSSCLVVDNVRSSRSEPLRTCMPPATHRDRSWPRTFYEYRKYTSRTRTVSLVSGGEVFGYLLDGAQSNMLMYAEAERVEGSSLSPVVKMFFRHFLIAERVNPMFESDFLVKPQRHGVIILGLSPVGLHTNVFPIRQRIDDIGDFVLLDDDASNKSIVLRSNHGGSRCTSTLDSKSTLLPLTSFARLPKLFSALCNRITAQGESGDKLVVFERQRLREARCESAAQASIALFDSTRPGIYFRPSVVERLRKALCQQFFDTFSSLFSSVKMETCFGEGRFPCSDDLLTGNGSCSKLSEALHNIRNATVRVHFDHHNGAVAPACPSKSSMAVDIPWESIWNVSGDDVLLLIFRIPFTRDIPNGRRGKKFLRRNRNSSSMIRTSVNDIAAVFGAPFFRSNDLALRMDGVVEIWKRRDSVDCTEAINLEVMQAQTFAPDTSFSSWWATLLGMGCVVMIVTNVALLSTYFRRCNGKRR